MVLAKEKMLDAYRRMRRIRVFEEKLAEPKRPTLVVEGDRVAGCGGCNRYAASSRETARGEIAIGPIAAARMARPKSESEMEARFQASLAKVARYAFLAGGPLLEGMDGTQLRSILLARD